MYGRDDDGDLVDWLYRGKMRHLDGAERCPQGGRGYEEGEGASWIGDRAIELEPRERWCAR